MVRTVKPLPKFTRSKGLESLFQAGFAYRFWYRQAFSELQFICNCEGWDIVRAASILAITSPRVAVRRNVRITLQYLATGEHLDNVLSSVRASVARYENTGEFGPKSPKVESFAYAILGDSNAIVIDVWVCRALGITEKAIARPAVRAKAYDIIRKAAKKAGVSPSEYQAAIWAGAILQAGRNPIQFPILDEYQRFLRFGRCYPSSGAIVE